jgi:hypothetical protein
LAINTASLRWCLAVLAPLTCCSSLVASIISSSGGVSALTDVSQLVGIVGTADFDGGLTAGAVALDTYTPQGLTFHIGALSSILSGVTTLGTASQPYFQAHSDAYFPATIAGGGTHVNQSAYVGGVATFSTTITQVGFTASSNGDQFLTAWDKSGKLLGQVNWVPQGASAFIGIDTLGVPIGMIAYGNDDLLNHAEYAVDGDTTMIDSLLWAAGSTTVPAVPEPASLFIWGLAIAASPLRIRPTA